MTSPRYDSSGAAPGGPGLPPHRELSDRLCGCGCGHHTLIATRTRRRDQVRRGEPLRFVLGHNRWHRSLRPTDRPCDPGTVLDCGACGKPMHAASHDQRLCAAGHPSLKGRGLCRSCYDVAVRAGTRADYPPALRSRGELLDEWQWMRSQGVSFREFPGRVGMTFAAWERAFYRARKAGDPRAARTDDRERCAA